MKQPDLFDLAEAREARDAALARVAEGAGEDWAAAAWGWLLEYLRTHAEFFPDDVWAAGLAKPPELRAFGPLVLRAARLKYITKTGTFRQRTRGHATAAAVWRSELYTRENRP